MIILIAAALQVGNARHYEEREFESTGGIKLTYQFMQPAGYDQEKAYPLVLCLHGRGGHTTAAETLAKEALREAYPCFVVAPSVGKKYRWASPTKRDDGVTDAVPAALEIVDAVMKEFSVDPARVYVTGQSMGGYGSFGAVAARPELFAAAVPVCGGWAERDAESMKGTAFWVFHGDADPTVPVDGSRRMVEALKAAGATVEYTEYPGVGHNSWDRAYETKEMWAWVFERRR